MQHNISNIPGPLQTSLDFRSNLAKLITPLRRIRPRVPFFQLPAHRIPTLWQLYRGLIKEAPTENIRWRMRMIFRREQHRTSAQRARKHLLSGYKWLDAFRKANHESDEHYKAVVKRWDSLLATKREKHHWRELAKSEMAWQEKMARRPILTGAFIRGSILNKPLPRMKPQPKKVHFMIRGRLLRRNERAEKLQDLSSQRSDLRIEADMERGLEAAASKQGVKLQSVYSKKQDYDGWLEPNRETASTIQKSMNYDIVRAQTPYSPELLATLKAARAERSRNKTRERERERKGEVLNVTIKRRRKGPPAHVLSTMTDEQKHVDKIVRSGVSEVGYVGMMKRKKGFKMKGDPALWMAEEGGVNEERRKKLDQAYKKLRLKMNRKRAPDEE